SREARREALLPARRARERPPDDLDLQAAVQPGGAPGAPAARTRQRGQVLREEAGDAEDRPRHEQGHPEERAGSGGEGHYPVVAEGADRVVIRRPGRRRSARRGERGPGARGGGTTAAAGGRWASSPRRTRAARRS